MKKPNCPVGLSLLATFNMIAAVLGFLWVVIVSILATVWSEDFPRPSLMPFIIVVVFSILYLISGIGYFKVRWYQGFVLGNVTAIAALLSIAFSSILKGTVNLDLVQQILLKLIFPVITLLLLNLRYRKLFMEAKNVSKTCHEKNENA